MIYDGRYKMSVYHGLGLGELFDLEEDPGEFADLWEDPGCAGLKADLLARHFDAMMQVSGAGPQRTAEW
jgi:hypothetical protein